MARCYSCIYSKLVEGNDDIVGHIAYALYKADKIHFIGNFKNENSDNDPDEKDLKYFHDTTCCPGNLERYKKKAIEILQGFTDQTLGELVRDMEGGIVKNIKTHIKDAFEPFKPKRLKKEYWHGITQSIIGAFIFAILFALLLFIFNLLENEYIIRLGGKSVISIQQYEGRADTIN